MTKVCMVALVVMVLLCLVPPALGFCSGRMGFCTDFAALQDIFLGDGSFQLSLDLRVMVYDEFQVRIPVALSVNGTSLLCETGIILVYYPWQTGPFMGLSIFQAGFSHGDEVLEKLVNLNEVLLGWSFEFGPGLFIEPCLVIRDPSGTFSDEYSALKGAFPCYRMFRGRLSFGWYFWR